MPRKRRVEKRRVRVLRPEDVNIFMLLNFSVGWRPPATPFEHARSPWATWEEFLADWAAIRDEGLAKWREHRAGMIAQLRRTIAERRAELERAQADWGPHRESSLESWERLLRQAEERLAEEEAELAAGPFAERAYRRALRGESPDPRDADDGDDEDDGSPAPRTGTR